MARNLSAISLSSGVATKAEELIYSLFNPAGRPMHKTLILKEKTEILEENY